MSGKIQLSHTFEDIISLGNLLSAWREFARGKRHKKDLQEFQSRLMDNLIALHADLASGNYRHGGYHAFNICDPKPRNIHKASVRDRLVHHAIYRILYPFFDRTFISDSHSCRLGKGTHKALARFKKFAYIVSKNNTRTCWILKGDIRKFFASIDHQILKSILAEHVPDQKILGLLDEVIDSFNSLKCHSDQAIPPRRTSTWRNPLNLIKEIPRLHSPAAHSVRNDNTNNIGLPLGNLTSQLLVNIYLNKFDQFIKHELRIKYYVRYADDFVIFSEDKNYLKGLMPRIGDYLLDKLKLTLHPDKIFIKTLASGVDFLGWVHFFDHRVLRTKTKRRMLKKIAGNPAPETINFYLGLLKHGYSYKIKKRIENISIKC